MKETINLKRSIELPSKIIEITSISLDNNFESKNDSIEGIFTLFGTYQDSKLNKKEYEFNESIPYSYDFLFDIIPEKSNVEIKDFTYTIDNNLLNLDIEYEVFFEKDTDKENIDRFLDQQEDNTIIEVKEINEENKINNIDEKINQPEGKSTTNYVTYKIYVCEENDTLETIASKNNINIDKLKEINESEKIFKGMKIIIPNLND